MSEKRPVSLKDVASAAGVSVMTASRVLAGKGPVTEQKRAAVRAAAERLGYRPNPVVGHIMSNLRRRRTQAFHGVIVFLNTSDVETHWRTLPYLRPCWEGALRRATTTGFKLDDLWVARPGWTAERTRAVLEARSALGVLVVPGSRPEHINFPLHDLALASFGGLAFPLPIHEALPDYFFNLATCFRHLVGLGYRRIGYFTPDYERKISDEQALGGFLVAQHSRPENERVPVGLNAPNWASAEEVFKHWVRQHRPDAVIASYNQTRRWLEELGLRCPRDIGLAHPSLAKDVAGWSGIDPNLEALGAQALDLLTAQIFRNETGLPRLPKRLTIRGVWIPGETTRPQGD